MTQFLFFLFVHFSILIPGYALVKKTKLFFKKPQLELLFAYIGSVATLAGLSLAAYLLKLNPDIVRITGWVLILSGSILFFRDKLWKDLAVHKFPLLCLVLMSLFSCAFVNLHYSSSYSYLPDSEARTGRNYEVLNVKILNLAKTQANDNYVPYRQAQFITNGSDPGKDCFICEWGVHFFQRTPLMGAVTASYSTLLGDKLPIDYLWSSTSQDPDNTYIKFQILANILNALFIVPAFFLIQSLFNKKAAVISSLFLIPSSFFLYNAAFSWPKSLVAFFVLTMWLLLLENRLRFTVLAGVVGGLAYLTHDLAILYIGASFLLLLFYKRFRHAFVLAGVSVLFALPWLLISSLIYKKPSTFVLYPFSLHGLPQPGSQKQIFKEFLQTSPLEIISIRFDTLFYLLSPYDLIYSGGGQAWLRRFWAVGIFSIPGSLGLGLVLPALFGAIKKLKKVDFWILVLVPVLAAAAIVGWRGSRAIASLHFAQAVIVLLTGLAVAWLVGLRSRVWLMLAFALNVLQLGFVALYSYDFKEEDWLSNFGSAISLVVMVGIVFLCGILIYRIADNRTPSFLR